MIEYTAEELERFAPNDAIFPVMQAAISRGDQQTEDECMRKLILAPASLLMMKMSLGSDRIIENGYNTTEAIRKFGDDWLERDNEELIDILHAKKCVDGI